MAYTSAWSPAIKITRAVLYTLLLLSSIGLIISSLRFGVVRVSPSTTLERLSPSLKVKVKASSLGSTTRPPSTSLPSFSLPKPPLTTTSSPPRPLLRRPLRPAESSLPTRATTSRRLSLPDRSLRRQLRLPRLRPASRRPAGQLLPLVTTVDLTLPRSLSQEDTSPTARPTKLDFCTSRSLDWFRRLWFFPFSSSSPPPTRPSSASSGSSSSSSRFFSSLGLSSLSSLPRRLGSSTSALEITGGSLLFSLSLGLGLLSTSSLWLDSLLSPFSRSLEETITSGRRSSTPTSLESEESDSTTTPSLDLSSDTKLEQRVSCKDGVEELVETEEELVQNDGCDLGSMSFPFHASFESHHISSAALSPARRLLRHHEDYLPTSNQI